MADSRGNIAPLIALLAVPVVGALAVGVETSSWYVQQRSEQNAADSAVIAVALNGGSTSEGSAVAKSYGYVNGVSNTTVTHSTPACPTGAAVVAGSTCYKVSITRTLPIYLSRIVGYTADVALGSGRGKLITSYAVAGLTTGSKNFCMVGLNSLTLSGGNGTDLTGCDLLSGGSMACNGQSSDFGVKYAYAAGNNQNCGTTSISNYAGYPGDPVASTVTSNISTMSCTQSFTGPVTLTSLNAGTTCITGNLTIGVGGLTVNNANTVLVMRPDASGNGSIILGNRTLSTASGASLTIVYKVGSAQLNTAIMTSNGGTFNVAAPSTGVWKGMVLVEDPALTGNSNIGGGQGALDFDFSGGSNSINLFYTGLFYLPHGTFNVSGAIDHAAYSDHNGGVYDSCIGIVAYTVKLTGTNDILTNPVSGCRAAGLTITTVPQFALLH